MTDDDDVAYVGDEDDERGPGCLVVFAAIASAFGMAGCVGSVIWFVAVGRDVANANMPGGILSGVYWVMMMGLSVIAGGFGMGLGIFSSMKARLSPRPWLRPVALVAATAGLASVIGIVLLVTLLTYGVRFGG